jgi:hypothetical protein
MSTYLVTFEDDIEIEVEAESEEDAEYQAEEADIVQGYVEPLEILSIELLTEERKKERIKDQQLIDKLHGLRLER